MTATQIFAVNQASRRLHSSSPIRKLSCFAPDAFAVTDSRVTQHRCRTPSQPLEAALFVQGVRRAGMFLTVYTSALRED